MLVEGIGISHQFSQARGDIPVTEFIGVQFGVGDPVQQVDHEVDTPGKK